MTRSGTVHLVDASPYIFRAWFAIPETFVDAEGRQAGAVFGFASFLLRYVETHRPTHLGVAFDGSLTTSFRNEIYADYKAQRGLPDRELEAQLDACREAAAAIGAAAFVDERYEADDLIATLCRRVARRGRRVVVVSGDKDLMQLVGPQVVLYDAAREVRYDARGVRAKLGVRPRQVPDFLGLAGDAVDNIPGVPGVGRKTAAALLARFAGLDELYAGLERVRRLPLHGAARLAERLALHREAAFLSRELATVACDAPVAAGLRELRLARPDMRRAEPLFERINFKGAIERLRRR